MSKNVKLGVVSALSVAVLAGCQSTGQHNGEMTQTPETNLMYYSKQINLPIGYTDNEGYFWDKNLNKGFHLAKPLSFEVPLSEVVGCGAFSSIPKTAMGTLVITKVDSVSSNSDGAVIHGYVSSDALDISKCVAAVEYKSSSSAQPQLERSVKQTVLPKLTSMKVDELSNRQRIARDSKNKESVEQEKLNWHINELNNTAKGIAMIKVCMEKGTYFLSIDKGAQKVIRDSESYARNDIRSKVTNKHYFNETAYRNAYQQEMQTSRFLWENDYLAFSEQCATMRNVVDSYINQ
ncbi:TPA: hypothetical protein GRI77_19785 [Vibrio parahaemolyticus]|uniref:hypothetical protein n=1 Tax=Vibrio parahaemolyticus TaxID=670 RepID=UPI0007A00B79|nr:hypothetical protein [Vibrio parahaemolyticus]EGQ9353244.1 hypothetical protein [Vibrio parahaemolyticus]EGQ9515712.1 hypothetical protein [Vibrio parahaemolyticus]EHR0918824.1 hypothetical protein [Vibrio parahaemolyticus]EIM7931139.1 hypothetical protein [Vibrio parahaemolyticus]EJQ8019144.1 hypothetical protein [Vibrio parahaemolyticus]